MKDGSEWVNSLEDEINACLCPEMGRRALLAVIWALRSEKEIGVVLLVCWELILAWVAQSSDTGAWILRLKGFELSQVDGHRLAR